MSNLLSQYIFIFSVHYSSGGLDIVKKMKRNIFIIALLLLTVQLFGRSSIPVQEAIQKKIENLYNRVCIMYAKKL